MSETGSDTSNTRKPVQYELVDKIGQGGMGAVYRGVHTKLHKVAAVKVLPSNRLEDSQAVQRFQREIVAVAQLDHPNIVGAIDAGVDDGKHYLVMELVDGIDLSTLIKKLEPMNVADACEVVRQAAVGLDHAHAAAMVHRDIKPSNLMLAARRSGGEESASLSAVQSVTVKILDMGLALLEDKEQEGMTTTGQMMGTMEFMAPEQAGDSHSVDSRADIYSLGATLFKLLSGEAPFFGEKYDTPLKMIRALALETPPSIQERRQGLPVELIALVDCIWQRIRMTARRVRRKLPVSWSYSRRGPTWRDC